MQSARARSENGNATVEFVAFALLIFAPLASFAAESSNLWLAKQRALNAVTQLARAYTISPEAYSQLAQEFQGEYQGLEISIEKTNCCVLVQATLGRASATSKQVL